MRDICIFLRPIFLLGVLSVKLLLSHSGEDEVQVDDAKADAPKSWSRSSVLYGQDFSEGGRVRAADQDDNHAKLHRQ